MKKAPLFCVLVLFWPAATAAIAWLLAADINPFGDDPRRTAKVFVLGIMAGGIAASLGFGDWWKLTMPEAEPESPRRFVKRTCLLHAGVVALVGAAYAFAWVIDPVDYRLLPSVVAVVSFAGMRLGLSTDKTNETAAPDVIRSPATRIPDSLKGPRDKT